MQKYLQNFLLTDLKIGGKSDFKKPSSWPDIRKSVIPNSIRLLADTRYPIGFIATVTGGYSVDIDGEHYGNYNSATQFSMADWSSYTDTDGYDITYPEEATKAHIIDIYPQTSGENITAFHCARVAASETEQQGVLWAHLNLTNSIDLSKGFNYTEYYNDLMEALTCKGNKLTLLGCDYCFYGAESLEYIPQKTDYSNVSDMTNYITNASNLGKTNINATSTTLTKIGTYGNSSHFINNLKSLRVSNEAPFNNNTSPQIDVSYTGMDRSALVQLFNDLPHNVGYEIVGSPTITDGVVSGFSSSDYLKTDTYFLDNSTELTDLEIQVKCVCPTGMTGANVAINYETSAGTTSGIGFFTNGRPYWLVGRDSISNTDKYVIYQTPLTAGNTYFLKGVLKNGTATLKMSTDGITWQDIATSDVSTCKFYPTANRGIGIGHSPNPNNNGYLFTGSIDLNNTYVKVNGIYWFRGQASMTKTLSCVGCTGTADLTADDESIVTAKGWNITK